MPNQTTEPSVNLAAPLFIGLQSYSEQQSAIFFGRDDEIDRLTNLIKANTLTIVFGKSGTGKTSLLNAGVFPRLRKDYCLPFRIRLEFGEDSPDLITQVKEILKIEIDKYGFKVDSYPTTETLWEYFHKEQLWKSVTPILIFDQFEEIFTLAKRSKRFSTAALENFWEELADLIENSIPEKLRDTFLNDKEAIDYSYKNQKTKILFSFREEFLPEFESITAKIPSIKYSRFRLMPMNGNQAYEVITKTWKNNIDDAQANKIVGFFTNEEDKVKSYDVLEIEPSLLSQVCAYLDKERIIDGSDKISAEFLNKYPKEIILRSIYNEVLTESNEAVKGKGNVAKNVAQPVNEFVEDKLITDEGYRTRYALTEMDAKLKPGIEVLKKKYFLRDDGKSVELSHDVLVPLIKADREQRRKEIALTLARAKAKKRAVQIIIGALFFSLAIAALIYVFTTKKARKDRAVAEKETVQIKKTIATDNIKLDSIKQRINELVVDKNDTSKILALQKRNIEFDSTIKMLSQQLQQVTETKSHGDSMNNEALQNREAALIKMKHYDSVLNLNHAQVSVQLDSLNRNYTALKNQNAQLNSALESSKNEYTTIKTNYDNLKGDFDLLKRNYTDLKSSKPSPVAAPSDKNSLQLNLYSSGGGEVPDNLTIYLIPDISANKKIIRESSAYEKHCDEANLQKAQGIKTASFDDKVYSFPDVPAGNYFIKICTYYGGYYNVTKKSAGTETSRRLDISPPVK